MIGAIGLVMHQHSCSRRTAVVFQTDVHFTGNDFAGRFVVMEGQEPADAAHDYVKAHNLTLGYRNAILRDAFEAVACTRAEPVIWRKSINILMWNRQK